MDRISLTQNGKQPLQFDGYHLAEYTPSKGLPLGVFSWKLNLYSNADGGYVLASQLEIAVPARLSLASATTFDSAQNLIKYLWEGDHHCAEPPMKLVQIAAHDDRQLRAMLSPACMDNGLPAVRPEASMARRRVVTEEEFAGFDMEPAMA
ncbi:hypothetical protein [Oceanidesulfovibrio marinus]|uniref:Uncharacterized protein n=1 Tax=Oceanidesulfovibrio marinus TaxID=370038 RepID=A0A6P1ZGA5_9BACT|nr:hypothetical protein [Oceanidesulfovibrio marinus]QJT08488.1 hypothetical protein E8L03_05905 [Oceanidesulfovibrio marinus]TVM33046.1 hypothetical protein DQK91_12840 [Oceanidesulfovibrio marinus]